MTTLNFQPAEPADDNPDGDETGCQCPPGDTNYLLEIDEGQAVLVHAACGKAPSYKWGDFQELTVMNPIPVSVEWETDCDGSPWHGMDPCDCDYWVRVTATSVPENVRKDALELSRKHAAERNASMTAPYCTGDRCEDCTPEEECCEATCGCCPRVDEHDHCRLAPGSEEDSRYCDQHGEGSLFDRSPEAERHYQILRNA